MDPWKDTSLQTKVVGMLPALSALLIAIVAVCFAVA